MKLTKLFTIFFISICILVLTTSSSFASENTTSTSTAKISVSSDSNYSSTETPNIDISSESSIIQKIVDFVGGEKNDPKLIVTNPKGKVIVEEKIPDKNSKVTLNNSNLYPGEYKVKVNGKDTISFFWGVLTINTDRDIYLPSEVVYLQMASLSPTGHTICNSNLELKITDPMGNVDTAAPSKSGDCGADNVTDSPDYFAKYQAKAIGTYKLTLKNLNNNFEIKSQFEVKNDIPFSIQRIGATRINPFKADYKMTIKVKASQDFSGVIKDTLPEGFELVNSESSWNETIKKGEEVVFSYVYRAPKVSPEIFFIGPVSIGSYEESRTWQLASDATFTMQTGYYVGNGTDSRTITGLGFSPDLVLIKDNDATGGDGILWKSTSMSSEVTALLGEAEADLATNAIQSLDSDGFTLGTDDDVNNSNTVYLWMAFDGSDCTSSGTFCVGSYTGNGTSQNITTGFQADLAVVKRSGASLGVWKSSSMGANDTNYFSATAQITDGSRIAALNATTFSIGSNAEVNTSANTYYFFAFKQVSGVMDVGTFTGNATDDRNITSSDDAGLTFDIDAMWVKNSATTVTAAFNITESYGDYSFIPTDGASVADYIQLLSSGGGFQVGTNSIANGSTNVMYYAAFGGSADHTASDTYQMSVGTYTGSGSAFSVSGLGFSPDLVIIKHYDQATDQYAVFRTSQMAGDKTAYFGNGAISYTGGITSIDSGGFTLGTDATTNTSLDNYYWVAFGNAWQPDTNSGAADFIIGQYVGNSIDNRDITRFPFQPDMVTVKRDEATVGRWRSTQNTGDQTNQFQAAGQVTGGIQALNSDGFETGTELAINGAGSTYHYFAFKTSSSFYLGTYTGNGTSQSITAPGFSPKFMWDKLVSAPVNQSGVIRMSTQAGDGALPFINSANAATNITALTATGFDVGAGLLANDNTRVYHYAVWKIPKGNFEFKGVELKGLEIN